MTAREIEIDLSRINVDPSAIESMMGIPEGKRDPDTLAMITELIGECLSLFEPRGGYLFLPAVSGGDQETIRIANTVFNTGRIIGTKLAGAEMFSFFMGTAGSGPEELSRSMLEKGNPLEGFVVDLIGSCLAESLAGYLHDQIGEEAKKEGRGFSNRYSPGYCEWNVCEQKKLFALFPDHFCNIRLSGSSLMTPIKSVSGVVATGTQIKFSDYSCQDCKRKDCPFRKTHPYC